MDNKELSLIETPEQAHIAIKNKEQEIVKLTQDINKIKEHVKNVCPYKIGDKVKVTKGSNETICYIAGAESYWQAPHYRYKLNKEKKDGTMSGQSAGIYYYDKVELIKRADEQSGTI